MSVAVVIVELPHDREGWARAVVSPAGLPLADHITIKETGVMLAVRVVVGCEILKPLDHLENVGLRVLVQRRDALRNHGATSHPIRSPRNDIQPAEGAPHNIKSHV